MPTLLVQMQTLACRLRSSLTTAEPLFLLSSQGGYTVAHCQKEISFWRAHTQLVLYFEGAAVPTADPQILAMRAPVTALVEKPKGWVDYRHLFSLGCAWQRRRRQRTRFSILHGLSRDRVGRRFKTTEIQRGRNRFSRWTDFPWVWISVLWEKVRGNATVFRRQRSLGMEAPVCANRKVQTCHQRSGCWREIVSREGIGQNKLCYKCRAILSAGSTKGSRKVSVSPFLLGLTHTSRFFIQVLETKCSFHSLADCLFS